MINRKWACRHICDDGLNKILTDFVQSLAKELNFDSEKIHALIDEGASSWTDVVRKIDIRMEQVFYEGVDQGRADYESRILEDYISVDDHEYEMERMREEVESLQENVLELEVANEELEAKGVVPHGAPAELKWDESAQCFVCPVTGNTFVLIPSETIVNGGVAAGYI